MKKRLLILAFILLTTSIVFLVGQKQSSWDLPNRTSFNRLTQQEKEQTLRTIAKVHGTMMAWNYLRSHFDANDNSPDTGHLLAHTVGSLLYEEKGIKGVSICTSDFDYGCVHGFYETVFAQNKYSYKDIERLCSKVGKIGSDIYDNCLHGAGHGLASLYQYDFSSLKKLLTMCDSVTTDTMFCYDGIFMEYDVNAPKDFYSVNNPLFPCNGIEEKYQKACARSQAFIISRHFHFDIAKTVGICWKSTDQIIKDQCIDALGMNIGDLSSGNYQYIVSQCAKMSNNEAEKICISSAAAEIIYQHFQNGEQIATALCNSVEDSARDVCKKRLVAAKKID